MNCPERQLLAESSESVFKSLVSTNSTTQANNNAVSIFSNTKVIDRRENQNTESKDERQLKAVELKDGKTSDKRSA